MALLSSAARNSTMRAISSGYSLRCRHCRAISSRSPASSSHRLIWRSVMIQPGAIELTRMLSGPKSGEAPVQTHHRGFGGGVAGLPPWPIIQLTEPKLMIELPPAAFIMGYTACAAKNWWRRFTAMRSSQYSGVTVSNV